MARLLRRCRRGKWAGVILSLLTLVAWAVSLQWQALYLNREPWIAGAGQNQGPATTELDQRAMYADFSGGCFVYYRGFFRPVEPDTVWYCGRQWTSPEWTPVARYSLNRDLLVRIPLWIPFMLFVLSTTLLFRRDRRCIPPGHWLNCGYDLTGNVSGVCPECGEKAATASMPEG